VIRFAVAVLSAVLCATASFGDAGADLYEPAKNLYRKLQEDGPEARRAETWRALAADFHKVVEKAPQSVKADDALYMEGVCFERAHAFSGLDEDWDDAVSAFNRLAQKYPESSLSDDAVVRSARISEVRGDSAEAESQYQKLLKRHADGDMADMAKARLARLGSNIKVLGIRHWSGASYTRIVVDLSGSTGYSASSLPPDLEADKSHRIFIDAANSRLGPDLSTKETVSDGLVTRIRAAQYDARTVRVVLDLEAESAFRIFPLESPSRIVVDVFRSKEEPDLVASLIKGEKLPEEKVLRIVIDPGHGGKDPGAVGKGGLFEKDVVLAIAKALSFSLQEKIPSCKIKLTRSSDETLSLEERTAIANSFEADLFISIHANASRSSKAKGIETYYLDKTSDRASRKLAAAENNSKESDLAEIEHILADVLLSSKTEDSKRLARFIQGALISDVSEKYGAVRDLGVIKAAPFYVLTGAAMPAVLVETSFITNPAEAKRLADTTFRVRTAKAMAQAVEKFVEGG